MVTHNIPLTEFIVQLLKIIEDNSKGMSYSDRYALKSLVLSCYQTYAITVTKEIPIANPKLLSTELQDDLKYQLGSLLGEALTEQCASFNLSKHKLTTTVIALKIKA